MTTPHPLDQTGAASLRNPGRSRDEFRLGLLFGLTTALCGGLYLTFARGGIVGGLGPADLTLCRFGIAGVIMAPVLVRRRFIGIGWRRAVVLTLFGGPAFTFLQTEGFRYAPLSHGAVIAPAAVTLISILLAAITLSERLGRMRLAGVALVIVGLGLICAEGISSSSGADLWRGDLLFIAAGAVWAVYTVLLKLWSVDPLHSTAIVNVLGLTLTLSGYLTWVGLDHLAQLDVGALALQAVMQGVVAGVLLLLAYSHTVTLLGPSRAALFPSMVPVISTLLAAPVLDELPTAVQLAGLAVSTLGLVLAVGVAPRWLAR